MKFLLSIIIFFSLGFASEELVLDSANSFITTMRGARNAPIKELIEQSKATIIFPSVKKIGFVVGGMAEMASWSLATSTRQLKFYQLA